MEQDEFDELRSLRRQVESDALRDPLVRIADVDDPEEKILVEFRPRFLPRMGEVVVIERRPWHVCTVLHELATGVIWITVRSPQKMAEAIREQAGEQMPPEA